MIKEISEFLRKDIWHLQLETLPWWKRLWVRLLRIFFLTLQGFTTSQIQQGASALTYYTLLAIVPMLALLVALTRGFGFERAFENWLISNFEEQEEIIRRLFEFANTSLNQANQGVIAGVGVALLLWAVIKILTNIEFVMNQVWEVYKGRSLGRQFTDFLALFLFAPLIIFLMGGLNAYLTAVFLAFGKKWAFFGPVFLTLFQVLSVILSAFLWTFLYVYIPNTTVRLVPAIIAGILTAILFQLIQSVYVKSQFAVSEYNAIYGTFAAIPLFLIWLHLSWVVILLGAKVSFAIQNVNAYEYISSASKLSDKCRLLCLLRILHLCVKKFEKGEEPLSLIQISNFLLIPLSLTKNLLDELIESRLLAVVKREKDQEVAFQPARSVESLTIKAALDIIYTKGEEIFLPPSDALNALLKSFETFSAAIERSPENLRLKDI